MYNDDTRKDDEDYMRLLYERFRKEVDSGAPIEYYELNELLDIYDYAQDEGDAMVQMFVFLTASRLYPTSKDFDERLAFFLSYVSQDAVNDMMARGGRRESALWDVLRMGSKCYPAEDPRPYLREILDKYEMLDCESVLKIIDLLRDMDRRDLLVEFYPELSRKAEDPRGLAFEVAETVKEGAGFQEEARGIAEDLTKQEPFNIEAWLLLARIEFGLEHFDEALAAVDYALAIDPEHFNAKLTRGVIMVVLPDKREEAIAVLRELLTVDPMNSFAFEGLAEAYVRGGDKTTACTVYADMIRKEIPSASGNDLVLSLIELDPDNLEDYLQLLLDKGLTKESYWREKAVSLMDKEKFTLAGKVIDFFHRKIGVSERPEFYLHTLYDARMLGRYAEVFEELAGELVANPEQPGPFVMTDYILLAAVYLRLGRMEEAARLCQAIEQVQEKCDTIDDHFRLRGIKLTAGFIQTLATTKDLNVDFSSFDPLTVDFLH